MNKIPTIKITYQGKPLLDQYFNEHPEIHHMYPSKVEFEKLHSYILKKAQKSDTEQILEISENSIKINGVVQI